MWSPNLRGGSDSPLLNNFPFAGSIEDEANYYRLHVDGFSGTVEDSFAWYHNKRSFSTPDSGNICAEISHGGWWYHQCFFSNLNGVYYKVKGGKGTQGWHSRAGDRVLTSLQSFMAWPSSALGAGLKGVLAPGQPSPFGARDQTKASSHLFTLFFGAVRW